MYGRTFLSKRVKAYSAKWYRPSLGEASHGSDHGVGLREFFIGSASPAPDGRDGAL